MEKKLRQVTDSVHGTVFLSEIESRMMSTPFFYRLHDIYQSSTVYMTYPSNRTKRYEHCLGTMELAGQMFFNALVNASKDDRYSFILALEAEFNLMLRAIMKRNSISNVFYCKGEPISELISNTIPNTATESTLNTNYKSITKKISDGMRNGFIDDQALNHQKIYFFDTTAQGKPSGKASKPKMNSDETVFFHSFLYQCALEALRIVALFHDVGHPPYSHIIENTMAELLKECNPEQKTFSSEKAEILRNILSRFASEKEIPHTIIKRTTHNSENIQMHEMVGLKMLQSAYEGVLSEMLLPLQGKTDLTEKNTILLYFITVVEFSFAILTDAKPVFASLHRIVDGPVDSDRLDYIVRDSLNAGTQWGKIPYRRLIGAAKLISDQKYFRLAFPEKMVDDLDDLIIARYKIFGRINYHHRTLKTSLLLQRCVKLLAEDYLRVDENLSDDNGEEELELDAQSVSVTECICPEIQNLWCALADTLGQREAENKIAQWNDSWLISVLSGTLIKLSDESVKQRLTNESIAGRSSSELELLKDLLSEVLLNHKHYYSILKRQLDAVKLVNKTMEKADITEEKLDQLVRHEYRKFTGACSDYGASKDHDSMLNEVESKKDATDALYRIQMLRENIIQKADFELLQTLFLGQSCKEIIQHVLKQAKDEKCIEDFLLCQNPNRTKFGFSDESEKDQIFLYDPKESDKAVLYDIQNTLYPLIQCYRTANLWLNVYIKPKDTSTAATTIEKLTNQISDELGRIMKARFDELFPPDSYLM